MSDKEILRGQVMAQVMEGKLRQSEAAARLKVTVRQVKRLKRSYAVDGIAGLISKKRGQPSNRRICSSVITQAMSLIGTHYADFGPTFACEKLAEQHGITLSVETVRQQMVIAGYWKPKRGRQSVTHPMRDRRSRRGELIQIDGSPHDWFEGRAAYCCLLVFIDDATEELIDLQFVKAETTLDYMAALERYIHRRSLPAALYSDRHSIFCINLPNAPNDAQTQFARALSQLDIEGIQAHSPQAKGRVERANQTLQDRLLKEMRLQSITIGTLPMRGYRLLLSISTGALPSRLLLRSMRMYLIKDTTTICNASCPYMMSGRYRRILVADMEANCCRSKPPAQDCHCGAQKCESIVIPMVVQRFTGKDIHWRLNPGAKIIHGKNLSAAENRICFYDAIPPRSTRLSRYGHRRRLTDPPRRTFMVCPLTTHTAVDKSNSRFF